MSNAQLQYLRAYIASGLTLLLEDLIISHQAPNNAELMSSKEALMRQRMTQLKYT
jgi:hypothetical protein